MGDFHLDDQDDPAPRGPHSRHPWWSRVLYLIYGLATLGAGYAAELYGHRQLAIGAAVIALVLFWKAAQKVR